MHAVYNYFRASEKPILRKGFMKRLFTLTLLAAAVTTANAQRKATVSGVVADADTKQTLIGALVAMAPVSDSVKTSHIVTGAGGTFSTGLTQEEYRFEVSLLGYETLRKRINVVSSKMALDTLFLSQGIVIDEVVLKAVAMRTSLEGDTLIYNADSYKVSSDSDVSGMLQKMPGIKVEGGTVEAQGEKVRKVLIDGREYFGEDVNAAITALPAEVVKSIEVFDKLSDNAEFTGIDDGEGYKAINIRTRESMRQGVMGQVSALYGVEPPDKNDDSWNHYGMLSGNVSIFQGDAKISVGGTLNNLNQRNFTADDFLGAGGDDGIAKVGVLQTNYIDTWGKKNDWKIDATYRYNNTNSSDYQRTEREYYETSTSNYSDYTSDSHSQSINQNHSFNARIDYKPNKFQELRIRPSVRYQSNERERNNYETYFPREAGFLPVPLNSWSNGDNTGWNTGLNVNYRVRLGKPGRTLSLFFNGGYNTNNRGGESYSEKQNREPVQQRTPTYNYGYNLMGGMTYTEPVSAYSLVNLDYSISYNFSDIDKKSYLYDFTLQQYDPDYDESYSGIYNSGYLIHRAGPGYRMQKKETTLSAGVFYQYSTLASTSILPTQYDLKADFNNVTYSLMVTSKFGKKNSSLRVFLNSYTRNPSVGNLQDVVDISNVQNITKGDPNLKPSYGNRLYTRLIFPNVERGRTFALHLTGAYTFNSITSFTIRDSEGYPVTDSEGNVVETLDAVGRYSQPINMDGEWSASAGVSYGFPLTFMKSNLNLDAGVNYNAAPARMGQWNVSEGLTTYDNHSRNMATRGGVSLSSNISERIDFRIGYDISYNNVRNTYSAMSNSDYLRHILNANCKFVLPLSFTIAANFNLDSYNSVKGEDLNRSYFIANASIGKKIFRSKQWEVNLFCNDIFNQNTSFRRTWQSEYMQNRTNLTIGRYFGVKLTWNIRKFGKNGSQNPDMYRNSGDGERMGPPGGGGGGYRGGGGGFGGGFGPM